MSLHCVLSLLVHSYAIIKFSLSQLTQVEAALSTSEENGDLSKLKADLEQLIALTEGAFNDFTNLSPFSYKLYYFLFPDRQICQTIVHVFFLLLSFLRDTLGC